MFDYVVYFFAVGLAYLLGSIPASVWVGKYFYDIDIREHGSKNAGATNTFRVLGKKAGLPVLIFDILKGIVTVKFAHFVAGDTISEAGFLNLSLVLGISAVIGHIFPVYVGFRGGKGIATLLGVALAINTPAALVCTCVFMIVFLISNYVSLSSMSAAFVFPIVVIIMQKSTMPSMIVFSILVAVLVLVTHQKNIERLFKNQESKINLFKKAEEINDAKT